MPVLLYSIAGVMLAAAVLVAAWALSADRSRGRRRCPRCFHAMDPAIGLVCPECGHDARQESRLFRTRRRWKIAAAALVLLGTPALLTAGLARVQQTGGWADLPGWVAVRLLWIEDAGLDKDIERRIHFGLLTRGQALLVMAEARGRLSSTDDSDVNSGLSLIKQLSRNSPGYSKDLEAVARPMLEELRPIELFDALESLLARDPSRRIEVLELLGHIKDADARAVIMLIENLGDRNSAVRDTAWRSVSAFWRESESGLVRRAPAPPTDVMDFVYRRHWKNGPPPAPIVASFAQGVSRFKGNQRAILLWARDRWIDTLADPQNWDAKRLPELWLWCRLDEFGSESWEAVTAATENGDPLVEEYAVLLLAGYKWSDETEDLLRRALRSSNVYEQSAAVTVSARFGLEAKALVPILLDQAASVEGSRGSSGLVDDFLGMGGDPEQLREALIRRLELIYAEHLDRVIRDMRPSGPNQTLHIGMVFWFLADIGGRDERTAAICHKFMEVGQVTPALDAAIAYAMSSGDCAAATRLILDRDPDLSEEYYVDSAQGKLLELVRRGLADPRMLMEHYERAPHADRAAFVGVLRNFVHDTPVIAGYLPMLSELATSESDPALQADAQAILDRYERLMRLERER